MDVLSILLKLFGIILIIVFIIVGIKIINLLDNVSILVKNVNDEMLECKKRYAPLLNFFDSISEFTSITGGFMKKILKKRKG